MVQRANAIPSQEEVLSYSEKLSNWGRWGPKDWMGTLNLITPGKRVQAARLVQEGVAVSCERPFFYTPNPANQFPPRHFMISKGNDVIMFGLHGGQTITHMDSPCHIQRNGTMYNGHPESIVSYDGAKEGGIEVAAADGIVSRGVLLDIARLKGKDWMEAGEAVFPEDLDAAESIAGVRVEEGDILLVRTGDYRRITAIGFPTAEPGAVRPVGAMPGWPAQSWAGLHAACLPWLHERGVAVLGTDSPNDVSPSGYEGLPIHDVGIWAMGLWLLDGCNHEELTMACAQRERWEFNLTLAPLRLTGCTGCPVNPIAVF